MKGKNCFSPLSLAEAEEKLNREVPNSNLLVTEMAFRIGRGGRGRRGRPIANAEVLEEMRILREEIVAMRETRRRDPEAGDVSEVEQEVESE